MTFAWPDEHLHWQGVIAAAPEFSVPFGVHVFVFHTAAQLAAACEQDDAAAFSSTYPEADANGVGAIMMFSLDGLELAHAAHESAHIALAYASSVESTRIGAKRWLIEHPEWVAEMIGNLTVLVWYAIPENRGDADASEE